MYVCICIYIYIYIDMHICVLYTYEDVCVHTYIYTHVIHICIHIYISTCLYTWGVVVSIRWHWKVFQRVAGEYVGLDKCQYRFLRYVFEV